MKIIVTPVQLTPGGKGGGRTAKKKKRVPTAKGTAKFSPAELKDNPGGAGHHGEGGFNQEKNHGNTDEARVPTTLANRAKGKKWVSKNTRQTAKISKTEEKKPKQELSCKGLNVEQGETEVGTIGKKWGPVGEAAG